MFAHRIPVDNCVCYNQIQLMTLPPTKEALLGPATDMLMMADAMLFRSLWSFALQPAVQLRCWQVAGRQSLHLWQTNQVKEG